MPSTAEEGRHADAREAVPAALQDTAQPRISVKQTRFPTVGRMLNAGSALPVQRKNVTGLPDALKAGVEGLSGIMLDDVRVRYNSPKAAEIGALAYAQGTEIHVGPGQDQHLPHEAWHVVQQKQGRVQPTVHVRGAAVNDDAGLEKEAKVMGAKAIQMKAMPGGAVIQRAYVGADAKEDVALFPKEQVADEAIDLSTSASSARAAALGITGVNLKHYLNRHTFKYQPLSSASTYPPQTGMFPIGTDKDAVKSMVVEAIGLVPAGKTVTADIESISVDLANGLKVNLGALAGNKLQAFFPQSGTGFHSYTNVELQAIKAEKDALEAPAKALAAKALKDKKDKQDAEKAEKAAKNKAFLAAKAAKAATPVVTPSTTTPVTTT